MTGRIWREERDGDLRPCPFCGGTDLIVVPDPEDNRDSMVLCRSCGASGCPAYYSNDAREHWNRRAERTCYPIEVVGEDAFDGTFESCVYYECSECHEQIGLEPWPRYCQSCGAKVVDEQ